MAQIQQYAIISLFVVLGGMLAVDFVGSQLEQATDALVLTLEQANN